MFINYQQEIMKQNTGRYESEMSWDIKMPLKILENKNIIKEKIDMINFGWATKVEKSHWTVTS